MINSLKDGLTSAEAAKFLKKYGYNELKEEGRVSPLRLLFRQIKNNFIIYLLSAAMLISFFVGKDITAYTILGVISAVVAAGFVQEYRAEKAIESLKKMVAPVSIVVRDSRSKEIPSREIVPGDLLILRSGEKVPADCVVLEERDILVNEAVLTGEAKEVGKSAAVDLKNYGRENTLFAGSFLVNGKCRALVVHTGMNTQFGRIAGMISEAEKELPLQKKVNKITKFMALVGASTACLTGILTLFISGWAKSNFIDVLILTIAIAVSAFPEGFPVVLITTLSLGAYRMAKRNAIVNRMSIIETLGETTVICTDKTGTITKGEMTVKKIFCGGRLYEVTGAGYEAVGDFLSAGKKIVLKSRPCLNLLLKTAVLCNDAVITKAGEAGVYSTIGSPTEAALLIMAAKAFIYKEDFSGERLEELTFNSQRKMMTVLVREGREKYAYSKGAPEIIINKCNYIKTDEGIKKITDKDKEEIIENLNKMTGAALRTICFAYKKTEQTGRESLEKDLIFLGIAGLEDPPRVEVSEAIKVCREAGIAVKMITGDTKETAISIGEQIGLDSGETITGDELDKITDEELPKIIKNIVIFARVKPEHKLRIVNALKANGEIVTMTGDGVNDAPALKEAHIGIAMGKNGTDVSRSVADLTLKDDNFATIVDAIKEGRTIFANIRKFISYQLSCNYAELAILLVGVLLSPILGWPVPVLLALHILFMNLVTDNLPAITLGFNRPSKDIMEEKPRKKANILTKNHILLLSFAGLLMASFSLGVFWFSFNILEYSVEAARTTTLVALIVLEIAGAFNFRSFRKGVLSRSPFVNMPLVFASIISILATIIIIYTPAKNIFGTTPISWLSWLVALGFAFIYIVIFDFLKIFYLKKVPF